jgi:hypothetical protein
MTLAHPLQWPVGRPRAKRREKSRFQVTLAAARDDLYRELELLGARQVTISSNAALNLNGTISARQGWIGDVGVALYFTRGGKELCIACDRWDTIGDNIRAIGLSVAAIRGLERWGTTEMVDAAFAGFAALPEATGGEAWWDVMGLASSSAPREAIEANYRRLAKGHHPDVGGDPELWLRIEGAYEQAKRAAGAT